jgi:hypothetical protein
MANVQQGLGQPRFPCRNSDRQRSQRNGVAVFQAFGIVIFNFAVSQKEAMGCVAESFPRIKLVRNVP